MIIDPAVIALFTGSFLVSLIILIASWLGLQIVMFWNLQCGSEKQLELEKWTYLVSTLMAYAFGFEILSLFLFVYTTDSLHNLFIGAMCAAGTLNTGTFGYHTLGIKILILILAGVWLVMNHVDGQAGDYPLIRKKYIFLLVIAPLVLLEGFLQSAYFLSLKADVITSCCGSLFSSSQTYGESPLSLMIGFPAGYLQAAFYGSAFLSSGLGFFYYRGFNKLGWFFTISSTGFFLISVFSLISFVSLYFYELPTHHCPFCILQREYYFIGYLLYGMLFGGVISGAGAGILSPFRKIGSLQGPLPIVQRRLTMTSLFLNFFFVAIVTWQMWHSNLVIDR